MSFDQRDLSCEKARAAFEGFDHTQGCLFEQPFEQGFEGQVAQLEVYDKVHHARFHFCHIAIGGRNSFVFFGGRDLPAALEVGEEVALRLHGNDPCCAIEPDEACKGAVDEFCSDGQFAVEGIVRFVSDGSFDAPGQELRIGFDIEHEIEEGGCGMGERTEFVETGHEGA